MYWQEDHHDERDAESPVAGFPDYDELHVELVWNTPKYGNDEEYADSHARAVFEMFYDCVNGRPNALGGSHRITCCLQPATFISASLPGTARRKEKPGTAFRRISPVREPTGKARRPC